ncbi:hypothetical protein VTL71DRAFT_3658 [Oculimacula yallundae]|uniref:Uncharacterized protein n=1 Tax=Oculimacula yallundae TaxID=86028 RepID=A0ABR4C4U5_9HELO
MNQEPIAPEQIGTIAYYPSKVLPALVIPKSMIRDEHYGTKHSMQMVEYKYPKGGRQLNFAAVRNYDSRIIQFVRLGSKPLMELNDWKNLIDFCKRVLKDRMMRLHGNGTDHLFRESSMLPTVSATDLPGNTDPAIHHQFPISAASPSFEEHDHGSAAPLVSDPMASGWPVAAGGLHIAEDSFRSELSFWLLDIRLQDVREDTLADDGRVLLKPKYILRSLICLGRHSCVCQRLATRNFILKADLLVSKYTVEFGPDDDGTRLFRDMEGKFTLHPGRLDLVLGVGRRRRKAEIQSERTFAAHKLRRTCLND